MKDPEKNGLRQLLGGEAGVWDDRERRQDFGQSRDGESSDGSHHLGDMAGGRRKERGEVGWGRKGGGGRMGNV